MLVYRRVCIYIYYLVARYNHILVGKGHGVASQLLGVITMTRSMPNDPQMLDLILQSRNMELVSTTVTFPVSSVSGFMAETYITSVFYCGLRLPGSRIHRRNLVRRLGQRWMGCRMEVYIH